MNCERCQHDLEDFIYGELSAAESARITAHLADCVSCRVAHESLEREAALFTSYYEQTVPQPTAEMWNAIRTRIHEEKAAAVPQNVLPDPVTFLERLRLWFDSVCALPVLRQTAFAAVLITASVTATAVYFSLRNETQRERAQTAESTTGSVVTPSPELKAPAPGGVSSLPRGISETPPGPAAKRNSPETPRPMPVSLKAAAGRRNTEERKTDAASGGSGEDALIQRQIARAANEYQGAIRLLERKINRRRDGLDATLVAQYEKSLRLIDQSIAESRRALREYPGDPAAGQFLLAAYARKVELMQEIALQ